MQSSDATPEDAGPEDVEPTFPDALPVDTGPPIIDVLQHHNSARRDGVYVDPVFTATAARGLHIDPTFTTSISGPVYAQPLYFTAGPAGKDVLLVVTERNEVIAFDAADGSRVWSSTVAPPVARASLPCGNIDPLGITGTPIIDRATRTIFFDAMTSPDGGRTLKHMVFALSIDDGSVRQGWPVDVSARVTSFDSRVENQRGALALLDGILYVPYGGHAGDCGNYHGTVIGISIADPSLPLGVYAVPARAGGIWAPGGISSDGRDLFVVTGNTFGATTWSHGEAVLRLNPGPVFSATTADYFAPSDWQYLDSVDLDLGGSAPVLFDVPGATPSQLIAAFGKNGKAYLVDRTNLGGISPGIGTRQIANGRIINAPAAYRTARGTYIALNPQLSVPGQCPIRGGFGDLIGIQITPTAPPAIEVAWCSKQHGHGSPMVTMTSTSGTDSIVWVVGAEGDNQLRGFNAENGATIFDGGPPGLLGVVQHFQTPIAAKGRIFVAANRRLWAFTP
ncbi:MAG: PQQ-binding-like beta-propeller repeat protein [Myxococcota bacterium]